MFPALQEMGFNAVTPAIDWWYGYPDERSVFAIKPLYDSTWRDQGGTISPEQLEMYLSRASTEEFIVCVQMLQYSYRNDDQLSRDYHQSGWGTYAGFRNTDGFLYGDGEGYENMLLHYLPTFQKYNVAGVFLGAENGNVEAQGGAKTRQFYRSMISAYRTAGFDGALSYAAAYWHNLDWPEMPPFRLENLDAAICGIPWRDMDYVGLTFYPTLAETFDATTREMYAEAQSQIDGYLRPFHDVHEKPLFILDMFCFGHDGCAIRPTDDGWRMSKSYDPEEQRRWHTALLRAFTYENITSPLPWIQGLTMFAYWLNPWIDGASFEERAMAANLNAVETEHLRSLAKVFFRDVPLED